MIDKDQDELVFEMDDDASMADVMGDPTHVSPSSKRTAPGKHTSSHLSMEGDLSMDDLLDSADVPEVEEDAIDEPEPATFPEGILANAVTIDMDTLLNDSEASERADGVIVETRLTDALVELDTGGFGTLEKGEFGDWSGVCPGDHVQTLKSATDPGPEFRLTLLRHHSSPSKPVKETTKSSFANVPAGTRYVIDGSNVCRSYMESRGSFLAPLLTLACTILEHGGDFICVFDGNERYVLGENRRESDSVFIYDTLLQERTRHFVEAPSTGPADDYLLKIAHRDRLAVISNDRFDKAVDRHRQQYPWIVSGGSRLLSGRIDFLTLIVPRLKLEAPLEMDLQVSLRRFSELTERPR